MIIIIFYFILKTKISLLSSWNRMTIGHCADWNNLSVLMVFTRTRYLLSYRFNKKKNTPSWKTNLSTVLLVLYQGSDSIDNIPFLVVNGLNAEDMSKSVVHLTHNYRLLSPRSVAIQAKLPLGDSLKSLMNKLGRLYLQIDYDDNDTTNCT